MNLKNSIQNRVENVFNQLIDELKIPMRKFKLSDPTIMPSKMSFNLDFRGYDDDYVDLEEFKKWSMKNENETKIPKLK